MSISSNNNPVEVLNSGTLLAHYYDLHGIFRLVLRSDSTKALDHFQAEYAAFGTSQLAQPDLDVTVSRFRLRPAEPAHRWGKHHHTNGWIYARENYKVARWHFAMNDLIAPQTDLYFEGGIFSLDFLQHFLVEQTMRYKISQRGCALVHGGCASLEGRSVLFPGLGHVGKTALAIYLTLEGWQFQADDYCFVSDQGTTLSYPRRLHISDHMYAACPRAMRHLDTKRRASILLKKLIYYLSFKYGDLSESLPLRELAPKGRVEPKARLEAVVFLNGTMGSTVQGPYPVSRDEMIKKVQVVNWLEARPFYSLYLSHHSKGDTVSPSQWWQQERDILHQALSDVATYEVQVPRHPQNPRAVLDETAHIVQSVRE